MFDCPNEKCKKQSERLIAGPRGLGCDHCMKSEAVSFGGMLHQVKFHKWGMRMTVAEANRIKTNKKRSDGRYKPDPRWR